MKTSKLAVSLLGLALFVPALALAQTTAPAQDQNATAAAPAAIPADVTKILDEKRALADLSLMSAQEVVKCVECAASVTRSDVRDDLDEFLAALEKLISLEHAADDELRQMRRWLIQDPQVDQRQPMLLRELCQAIESATDAHAHAGQMLRTYLLEEILA